MAVPASTVATAAVLGAVGALHVAWAAGSTFPLEDREAFSATFLGVDGLGSPGPAACLAVAGLVTTTACAAVVATQTSSGSRVGRLSRRGARTAARVLAARAAAGIAVSGFGLRATSPRFRTLDLTVYSPLCAALAVGLARSARATS
ncbi:DUF3995 domain-containing protein [Flavimobilis sp. GY10621]|uniref:DUF3995 domain-containing protein n=1 Tax=Flavimobilis rhizosphaerae TaxID=2775421 RepID=A0ABR9DQZ3_9MICO|nr:DUF3995 domain-containing protein [Flavimobilis rhizosphaerae]MBD9698727.1 DUF3995 domain-containing protein [Flavimobilis rhizosphaerae]